MQDTWSRLLCQPKRLARLLGLQASLIDARIVANALNEQKFWVAATPSEAPRLAAKGKVAV